MKNLEEEIELDEEQNEYSPPIFNSKNKKIEKNINISDVKVNKFQKTPPPNSQNFAKNYYQPSLNNKYNISKNENNSLKLQNQNQNIQYIPSKKDISNIQNISLNRNKKDNIKIEVQQEKDDIEYNEHKSNENQNNIPQKEEENINQKKSIYSSYFGDSNNNYYEIKGIREQKKEENEEEEEIEEENENEENENENINDINEKIKEKK